jgi:hypothetical protein
VDELRIPPAGDPFYAAAKSRTSPVVEPRSCPACYAGIVYLGELVEDPDTGEEIEVIEAVPCRKCSVGEDL